MGVSFFYSKKMKVFRQIITVFQKNGSARQAISLPLFSIFPNSFHRFRIAKMPHFIEEID